MARWSLALELDPAGADPIFLRIARSLMLEIQRGRLRPKDRLPGSRSLAKNLGVHRNTVIAAYQELLAEGWLESNDRRGTFVAQALPIVRPGRFAPLAGVIAEGLPSKLGFELQPAELGPLPPAEHGPGVLVMAGGVPDVRLVPTAALARAYRRVLGRNARAVLDYGDPRGHPRLREAIAAMLSAERGIAASADDVLITKGAQQALWLTSEALLGQGDVVAVEALGYAPAWRALSRRARLVPVAVDREGLDVDALAALFERTRVRAVYLTPHHQYPTMVTLSASRRLRLLELCRKARVPIIEDDYDHEVHYEGRPVLPLASVDRAGVVMYVGTLSKVLAPGLRLGYLVAPAPLIERAAALRMSIDRQGDAALEAAVASLFEDGEIQRHARRMRRRYASRRAAVAEALERELAGALEFELPPGGMAIWAHVSAKIDAERWAEAARDKGVVVAAGRRFSFADQPLPNLRIGFAALTEAELAEAVRRLASALPGSPIRRSSVLAGRNRRTH